MTFYKTNVVVKPILELNYDSKNMTTQIRDIGETYLTKSEEVLLRDRGFALSRQIGEGSYAKVYLATQRRDSQPDAHYACKIINTKLAPREFVVKFLPREIDILSKIKHPFIVHVYYIYHKSYNYLIFMRFAEMGDLLDYVVARGELPEKISRIWFHQLACAIYYLHSLNIAHRDIKCENILITHNFNVKLADFGFARYVADVNGKNILSSTYCGSLAYASPEILRGRSYFPKCSDIWSLGIVLFIMLNKSMPFHDGNVKLLYKQQMSRRYKFRGRVEQHLTKPAVQMVNNLLEPDFRKRIQANDLIQDLWFTEEGLHINEECRLALESTARYKGEMVVKKHSKVMKRVPSFRDDKDFILLTPGKELMTAESVFFDTNLLSNVDVTKEVQPQPKVEEKQTFDEHKRTPERKSSNLTMQTTEPQTTDDR